jgi:DNA mismatch repair protein MutS
LARLNGFSQTPGGKNSNRTPAVNACDDWWFDLEVAYQALTDHFQTQSLDGFGCRGMDSAIAAAGALLQYVQENMRSRLGHVSRLQVYQGETYVDLDPATVRNLELLEPLHDGPRQNSLLGVLNKTATPMGSRLLRSWIRRPLRKLDAITLRQTAVAGLVHQPSLLEDLQNGLKQVKDLERTLARLTVGSGNARDLLTLRISLESIPHIRSLLGECEAPLLRECVEKLDELPELVQTLRKGITDEPAVSLRDGGMIRTGFSKELDELHQAASAGKKWIAELQAKEQSRSGIKSLKIRYNKVFGYYIEITKANLEHVPSDYIRRQTLANAERFVTQELKDFEEKILGAEERSKQLEYDLFLQLRGEVLNATGAIQQNASAIASLDVLAGFAEVALYHNYCRPALFEDHRLLIREGRHPVLEQSMVGERFVPNDLEMDTEDNRLLIITGPNMAGKSTFIRQAALIAIMAQIGSYVPAESVEIGIADRIFTRVGASDDLSRGQSTFMVEMSETANILNNASLKSLVILDEIGRGTSTFDGLSIAWAVAEHLHDQIGARTLFATHYHELTELAQTHQGVQNLNVAVREWNDQIMFLHKILPGAADKSYGIHVARLAGLPDSVLERAREVLANLENNEYSQSGKPKIARTKKRTMKIDDGPQQLHLTLFEEEEDDE